MSAVAADRDTCPGPLVWFDAAAGPDGEHGAVLECGTCGHITVTGNLYEPGHAYTPLLRSPQ